MSTHTNTTCAVCLDDISTSESFPAGPDAVCADCAQEEIVPLFLNALEFETQYPPTWAGDQILNWEHYQELLPADYGQELEKRKLLYLTPKKERLYCGNVLYADDPSPDDHNSQDERCRKLALTKEQIADAHDNNAKTKTCGAFRKKADFIAVKCEHCAGYACGQCGAPRENVMAEEVCPTCNSEASSEDVDAYKGLKRGRDYQLCPNPACEIAVYLGDGCNHMTCQAAYCKTQFCYICGERATADSGHWYAANARCPRFNQPDAVNATYDHPGPTVEDVDRAVEANRSIFMPFDLHDLRNFEGSQPSEEDRFRQWELSDEELDARPQFLQDALVLLRQQHQIPYSRRENGINRLHANVHQLAIAVYTYLFRMASLQPSDLRGAIDDLSFATLDAIRLSDLDILVSRWGFLQLFDPGLAFQYPALSDAIRLAGRVWEHWADVVQAHIQHVTATMVERRRLQWELTAAEFANLPVMAQEMLTALRLEHQAAYAVMSIRTLDDALENSPHNLAFDIYDILRRIHTAPALHNAGDQTPFEQPTRQDEMRLQQWQQSLLHMGTIWRADWNAALARDATLETTYPALHRTVRLLGTTLRAVAERAGLIVDEA